MKLELKHLAPYLPYALSFSTQSGKVFKTRTLDSFDIRVLKGKSPNGNDQYHSLTLGKINKGELKPILRPMTDLTKEIEVNGVKFIPLVELAKLSFFKNEIHELKDDYIDLGFGYSFHFSSNSDGVCFNCMNGWNGKKWDSNHFVPNQLALFDKLNEWHFDTRELIEQGLAISIHDINK
jgi:hypothetical protein